MLSYAPGWLTLCIKAKCIIRKHENIKWKQILFSFRPTYMIIKIHTYIETDKKPAKGNLKIQFKVQLLMLIQLNLWNHPIYYITTATCENPYMQATEPKWVNLISNLIGVNSLHSLRFTYSTLIWTCITCELVDEFLICSITFAFEILFCYYWIISENTSFSKNIKLQNNEISVSIVKKI